MIFFRDRSQAGRLLGARFASHRGRADVVVVAVASGGVPVALEVARALDAPLGVVVVQRIVARGWEHAVLGAVAANGVGVVDDALARALSLDHRQVDEATTIALNGLALREATYRRAHSPPEVRNRFVVLVDEGMASGLTMLAASAVVHLASPARLLVAVPVAPCWAANQYRRQGDEFFSIVTLAPFPSIAACYYHHVVLKDEIAARLLQQAECERCKPLPKAA